MKSRVVAARAADILTGQGKPMTEVQEIFGTTASEIAVDPAHAWLQRTYDRTAQDYRALDEEHIFGRDYQHLSKVLREVSSSFGRPIRVLDLGCGTGRYFHCIQNARELVGLDISKQMIEAAHDPVRADEVTAREVKLVRGDLFSADFPDGHFDFIYCLGVFGNGCALSAEACARIWKWLAAGAVWVFDATDISGLPLATKLRKNLAAQIYSALPRSAKQAWVKRKGWPPFFGSSVESLRGTLEKAGFVVEWVMSRRSQLTQGEGYKLEALCRRG